MRKKSGFTLVEILVYTFCIILALTGVYAVLITSMQDYDVAQAGVGVQQSTQNALHRLSGELAESDPNSICYYDTTTSCKCTSGSACTNSASVGIVFESARDPSASPVNKRQYVCVPGSTGCNATYTNCLNTNTWLQTGPNLGFPCWQKYICYYMYADSNSSGEDVIYRKEGPRLSSPTPTASPPTTSYGPVTPNDFRTDTALTPEKIAGHLDPASGFSISQVSGTSFLYLVQLKAKITNGGNENSFTTNDYVKVNN